MISAPVLIRFVVLTILLAAAGYLGGDPALAQKAYIPNAQHNTVSVVDGSTSVAVDTQ
ncbi:MAG: hypothetical protein WDN69_36380 [Aliidongia sp.]